MIAADEKKLLDGCFKGDRASWDDFVERYSKLVYYSIHQTFKIKGRAAEPGEIEDLYGSVFLALFDKNFAKLRSFKGRNNCTLASWIRLIASNMTYDYMREKFREERLLDHGAADGVDAAGSSDAESETLDSERAAIAREALSGLNADELSFVFMYYEKEMSPERIAETLGVSLGTVYSKKSRITDKLRKLVAEKTRD